MLTEFPFKLILALSNPLITLLAHVDSSACDKAVPNGYRVSYDISKQWSKQFQNLSIITK